jgi:hypothetical protein
MTDWLEHDGGPQPVWDAWVMYRQDPHRLFPTKLGALRKGDLYRILNQHLIDAARLEGIRLGLEAAAEVADHDWPDPNSPIRRLDPETIAREAKPTA